MAWNKNLLYGAYHPTLQEAEKYTLTKEHPLLMAKKACADLTELPLKNLQQPANPLDRQAWIRYSVPNGICQDRNTALRIPWQMPFDTILAL